MMSSGDSIPVGLKLAEVRHDQVIVRPAVVISGGHGRCWHLDAADMGRYLGSVLAFQITACA